MGRQEKFGLHAVEQVAVGEGGTGGGGGRLAMQILLFSEPANPRYRVCVSCKVSTDYGATIEGQNTVHLG